MPTVLVTGASRGIGLEFVRQYAADGWRVIAAARDPEGSEALAGLARANANIALQKLDVTDDASIAALGKRVDEPIDVLINNAGVGGRGGAKLGETDKKAWIETLVTNLIGPIHVTEALLPHLERGGRKQVIMISSRVSSNDVNLAGGYAYASSKAALNRAMRTMSRDLGEKGFTVVSMCPGWVRTDMGSAAAPVAPEDSIAGMRKQIAALTPAANGQFTNYASLPIAW
ncbi:MAG: SDR family oxidoreductase [Hyphomonadaceae bacterium]